tara:strand:+ start:544 stop:732 length:189 start_codon:yes stop_codon:yes gene_type:complete
MSGDWPAERPLSAALSLATGFGLFATFEFYILDGILGAACINARAQTHDKSRPPPEGLVGQA